MGIMDAAAITPSGPKYELPPKADDKPDPEKNQPPKETTKPKNRGNHTKPAEKGTTDFPRPSYINIEVPDLDPNGSQTTPGGWGLPGCGEGGPCLRFIPGKKDEVERPKIMPLLIEDKLEIK